jgi:hypothetical protein
MQIGIAKETVYGTRVTPTHFFEVTEEGFTFDYNKYRSVGLGGGLWRVHEVQTTRFGEGPFPMEVPTSGFGTFLDLLHGNTVTPVQQGTTTAYLQTHTLSSSPSKSATIQVGVPPISTPTPLPFDYIGCMLSGIEFSWEPAAVLMASLNWVIRDQLTDQSLASFVAPTFGLFSFKGGSISVGGVDLANVTGGGSLNIEWSLRTDAFALGSTGIMAKPIANDRATAGGSITADFTDMTNYDRVVNQTIADVVLEFEGATIVGGGSNKETITVTIPDCSFDSSSPSVSGPGPVVEEISFTNASATNDPPVITYKSIDTSV